MKNNMPPKEYYTFKEVTNLLQCSMEDLRYYVINGVLSPSRYLDRSLLTQYIMRTSDDYATSGDVFPTEWTSSNENNYGAVKKDCPGGFFYLLRTKRKSARDCEFQFAADKRSDFDISDVFFKLTSPIGIEEVLETCVLMTTELDRIPTSNSLEQDDRKVQISPLFWTDTETHSSDASPEPIAVMPDQTASPIMKIDPKDECLVPAKPDGTDPVAEARPLGTTERNSLLKLVIGMAIKGYKYAPSASKNTAINEIVSDLDLLGMEITDDTVRKHLKEAVRTVLPSKPGPP